MGGSDELSSLSNSSHKLLQYVASSGPAGNNRVRTCREGVSKI